MALQISLLVVLLVLVPPSPTKAAERSPKARADFIRLNPCPATGSNKPHYACKGYVVDHIIPLSCNGLDHHSNMQWQTVADAKAKDKWERKNCRGT